MLRDLYHISSRKRNRERSGRKRERRGSGNKKRIIHRKKSISRNDFTGIQYIRISIDMAWLKK
jgi:hypothetical protein